MKALVWKDLYSSRNGIWTILVFALVFGFLFRDSWFGPMIVTMLFANVGSSTLSWDEQCQWSTFAVSSGISRRTLVSSKLEAGAIFVALGAVIGAVVSFVFIAAGFNTMSYTDAVEAVILGAIVSMAVMGIMVAVTYWTGNTAKAQYLSSAILIVVIVVLVAVSITASETLEESFPEQGMLIAVGVMAVVAAAAVAVSYEVSCRRLERRDL